MSDQPEILTCKECGKEVTRTFRGMCDECHQAWIEERENK